MRFLGFWTCINRFSHFSLVIFFLFRLHAVDYTLAKLVSFRMHTVSQKNMPPYFCPYLRQILTDFKSSFTGTLCGKFAIKWLLIIPPLLNIVATLPCETLMSVRLAIAAVSSRAQQLFGHFRKFRPRSQQMIRMTLDCDLSLWIPDVLNDVFMADLPGLIPVY